MSSVRAATLAQQKELHGTAYQIIHSAVDYEEQGKEQEALDLYMQGAGVLHDALALRFARRDLDQATVMADKMRKTLGQVEDRIHVLTDSIAEAQAKQPDTSAPSSSSFFGSFSLFGKPVRKTRTCQLTLIHTPSHTLTHTLTPSHTPSHTHTPSHPHTPKAHTTRHSWN